MLKMVIDAMGSVVMTNNGNAILREIDVTHPAAKCMIELSRTQHEEVGDGTTTVIILGNVIRIYTHTYIHTHPFWCPSASHSARCLCVFLFSW